MKRLLCTWFLELFLFGNSVCVFVCVCPPPGYKNCSHEMKSDSQSNKSYCFYITLAIDITDGHGVSNEACHEFLPKKNK